MPQDVFSCPDFGSALECISHALFGVDRSMIQQAIPERWVKFHDQPIHFLQRANELTGSRPRRCLISNLLLYIVVLAFCMLCKKLLP